MNIKKIVLACATVSLLYCGNVFAKSVEEVEKGRGIRGSTIEKGIVSERAKVFGEQVKWKRKKNDQDVDRSSDERNDKTTERRRTALSILSEMKKSGKEKTEVENIPEDLFSKGKTGTYKAVGSEFGTHIQDVWNLSSDATAGSEEVGALLTDLSNTATVISLSEGDTDGRSDVEYDFSEIDENDFQGIIAKNDSSKAFYFNAIAKIADILHKGTEGHVFWHGMFKVMVKLLITDHYLLNTK